MMQTSSPARSRMPAVSNVFSRSSALLFEDVAEVRWDDVYTSQSVNKPTERVGFGFRLSW